MSTSNSSQTRLSVSLVLFAITTVLFLFDLILRSGIFSDTWVDGVVLSQLVLLGLVGTIFSKIGISQIRTNGSNLVGEGLVATSVAIVCVFVSRLLLSVEVYRVNVPTQYQWIFGANDLGMAVIEPWYIILYVAILGGISFSIIGMMTERVSVIVLGVGVIVFVITYFVDVSWMMTFYLSGQDVSTSEIWRWGGATIHRRGGFALVNSIGCSIMSLIMFDYLK